MKKVYWPPLKKWIGWMHHRWTSDGEYGLCRLYIPFLWNGYSCICTKWRKCISYSSVLFHECRCRKRYKRVHLEFILNLTLSRVAYIRVLSRIEVDYVLLYLKRMQQQSWRNQSGGCSNRSGSFVKWDRILGPSDFNPSDDRIVDGNWYTSKRTFIFNTHLYKS